MASLALNVQCCASQKLERAVVLKARLCKRFLFLEDALEASSGKEVGGPLTTQPGGTAWLQPCSTLFWELVFGTETFF